MKLKSNAFLSFVLISSLHSLSAQESQVDSAEVQAFGILPNQRKAIVIGDRERNPFGEAPGVKKQADSSAETEEYKIRSIFKNLNVTGVRRDADGQLMAVAEDLFFKVGEKVKPVLAGQFEQLTVSSVTADQVELSFLETKDATQPRKITLPIVTAATVKEKLYASKASGKNSGADFYVVGVKGVIMPTAPTEEIDTAPVINKSATPNIIPVAPSIEPANPTTAPQSTPKTAPKSVIE